MWQKIKDKLSPKRIISLTGLTILLWIALFSTGQAQTITQGYLSDNIIQRATIVSLSVDNTKKVEPTNLENQSRLHGVVVSQNDAPFTLSNEDEKTFVATKGRFDVFVSNENGVVQAGDYVAISRVAGIGMKAGEKEPYIVGKAVTAFDGEDNILSKTTIEDGDAKRQVAIGRIKVDLGVGGNPLLKPTQANLPGFLEKLAENIAQKPVNPTRIYLSIFILITAAVVAGTLLYSGVRSGIISIGRNPLSKKSITKSLLQVILTSVIILLLGLFGVYLLLKI